MFYYHLNRGAIGPLNVFCGNGTGDSGFKTQTYVGFRVQCSSIK